MISDDKLNQKKTELLIGILQYMINGTDMYYVVLHLDNSTTRVSERINFFGKYYCSSVGYLYYVI